MIQNIALLQLTQEQENKLLTGAQQHLQNSNITFKVLSANTQRIIIYTRQRKQLSRSYADQKTLIARTKELFEPIAGDTPLHVHAKTYK